MVKRFWLFSLLALGALAPASTSQADITVVYTQDYNMEIGLDPTNIDAVNDIEVIGWGGAVMVRSTSPGCLIDGAEHRIYEAPLNGLTIDLTHLGSAEVRDLNMGPGPNGLFAAGDLTVQNVRRLVMRRCKSGITQHSDIRVSATSGLFVYDCWARSDLVLEGPQFGYGRTRCYRCDADYEINIRGRDVEMYDSHARDIRVTAITDTVNMSPTWTTIDDCSAFWKLAVYGTRAPDNVVVTDSSAAQLLVTTSRGEDDVVVSGIADGMLTVNLGEHNDVLCLQDITTTGDLYFDGGKGSDKAIRDDPTLLEPFVNFEAFGTPY